MTPSNPVDVTVRVHYEAKRDEIEPFLDPDSVMDSLGHLVSSSEGSGTEEEMALRAVAEALSRAEPSAGDTNDAESHAG